jgi:dTDP-4-dehydrorhamnose reductase
LPPDGDIAVRVLILGASGMLGHTLFYELNKNGLEAYGTVRQLTGLKNLFPPGMQNRLLDDVDAYNVSSIIDVVNSINPDVIINCIGLIRQRPEGQAPLPCIEINARFPHLLYDFCKKCNIRLIHYSTDCVFDGKKGSPYTENDLPSAKDIYGMSKYLGELWESPALTISTSIIGPELHGRLSLLEWFLSQEGQVNGYTHAMFTGLPTCEHARILMDYILPHPELFGLFQVVSQPISKYELLRHIANTFHKNIDIRPLETVCEDRRLTGDKFFQMTGYAAPDWPELVKRMCDNYTVFQKELL